MIVRDEPDTLTILVSECYHFVHYKIYNALHFFLNSLDSMTKILMFIDKCFTHSKNLHFFCHNLYLHFNEIACNFSDSAYIALNNMYFY